MVVLEFIQANKLIAEELLGILKLGKNNTDAGRALVERCRALRSFIAKWQAHISPNFIKHLRNIVGEGEMYGGAMPTLPDARAFNLSDSEQLGTFLNNCNQAWNDLIAYKDREASGYLAKAGDRPINKFIDMTERLDGMIIPRIKIKSMRRSDRLYTLVDHPDYPDRLMSQIDDERDVSYYREMEKRGINALDNLSRVRVFETWDLAKAQGEYTYKKHDGVITGDGFSRVAPVKERIDIMKELEDDQIMVPGIERILPAEIYNGVKIPMPEDKKGTRYHKTILQRASREILSVIADKLVAQKQLTKLPELDWKRDDYIKYVEKNQKKRDVDASVVKAATAESAEQPEIKADETIETAEEVNNGNDIGIDEGQDQSGDTGS